MSYFMIDIESDGPCPGLYNMVCFGAVVVRPGLKDTFYGQTAPVFPDKWNPEALAISGFSREEHLRFPDPAHTMRNFATWVHQMNKQGRPRFIADNNGFDWQFINWYFHKFLGENPFGYSSANLNSLYKGLVKNDFQSFKHLRKTKHDHNPVNDAIGNAEALLHMRQSMALTIALDK
jgi:hypothetical protein